MCVGLCFILPCLFGLRSRWLLAFLTCLGGLSCILVGDSVGLLVLLQPCLSLLERTLVYYIGRSKTKINMGVECLLSLTSVLLAEHHVVERCVQWREGNLEKARINYTMLQSK